MRLNGWGLRGAGKHFQERGHFARCGELKVPHSHCTIRKPVLLLRVPLGVVTKTKPLVAPAGTVAAISELDTTVNTAVVPLNVTMVASVRFVPRMITGAPTLPKVVCVSTNGASPTFRLKTVPTPDVPPFCVVP